MSIQIYRICQEAISNAVRHGQARHVLIDLIGIEDRLILTLEDDGKGIEQSLPGRGMELYPMNYRARLIGGSLTMPLSAMGFPIRRLSIRECTGEPDLCAVQNHETAVTNGKSRA